MLSMETVVVTGGAGFIGSNLVIELVKRGYAVRVVDNFLTGSRENLEPVMEQVELFGGSITDKALMDKVCKNATYVFHEAALPSVPRSIKDPITTNQVNVNGTLTVLLAARDAHVKRVVFASSSSVYGDAKAASKAEALKPDPLSPYAATKLLGELYCRQFTELYGLETVSLRYFNVFGPRQDPASQYAAVIPRFIQAMLHSKQPVIFGDGTQSRDFTFVQNVVEANILAAKAKGKDIIGNVFNIACGHGITINTLVQAINKLLKTDIKAVHEEPRQGDIKHSQADVSKAARLLGFKPAISFEEGLKQTIGWFKNIHA